MATDPGGFALLDNVYKFIQTILLPLLGYGAYVLRDIRNQLQAMNGRLLKSEAWMKAHEKLDDDRFSGIKRELDQLQRSLHGSDRVGQ